MRTHADNRNRQAHHIYCRIEYSFNFGFDMPTAEYSNRSVRPFMLLKEHTNHDVIAEIISYTALSILR